MNYYERHLGDWLKDTSGISMLEEGAYNRLVDAYYSQEHGIEHDRRYLISRAMSVAERRAVDSVLSRYFRLGEDGFWVKGRVEEEIAKARVRICSAKENGKLGGRPRKGNGAAKEKPTGFLLGSIPETQPITQPITQQKALHTPDTIEAKARSKEESDQLPLIEVVNVPLPPTVKKKKPAGAFDFTPPEWVPADAWARFVASRALKHPLTSTAAALIVSELSKFKAAGHDPAAVLDQSVMNGWRGVFEPKVGSRPPPASGGVAASFEGKVYNGGATDDELDVFFGSTARDAASI